MFSGFSYYGRQTLGRQPEFITNRNADSFFTIIQTQYSQGVPLRSDS